MAKFFTFVRYFVSSCSTSKPGSVRIISKGGNTLFTVNRRVDGLVFIQWADGTRQSLFHPHYRNVIRSGVRCGCNDVLIDVTNSEVRIVVPRCSGFSVFTTL